MTLTLNFRRAMVMIHMHAKNPGQRLVGLKDVVETDGRTDTADRITFPANEIGNQYFPQ